MYIPEDPAIDHLELEKSDDQADPKAAVDFESCSGFEPEHGLVRLAECKLKRVRRKLAALRSRMLAEVISGFSDFPAHLALEDQGRFAIGYYHQMQEFYTKKTETNPSKGE